MSNDSFVTNPFAIVACTISHDLQDFTFLIDGMEAELGERWGDLVFEDALGFLEQPAAAAMEFIVVGLDASDIGEYALISAIIGTAKRLGVKVVLVASDLGADFTNRILQLGVDHYLPYPMHDGELRDAVFSIRAEAIVLDETRSLAPGVVAPPEPPPPLILSAAQRVAHPSEPAPQPVSAPQPELAGPEPQPDGRHGSYPGGEDPAAFEGEGDATYDEDQEGVSDPPASGRSGIIIPVQGYGGGAGCSTIAVNLAWELVTISNAEGPKVCLLDLDLQRGSIASYLDLAHSPEMSDIISDAGALGSEGLSKAFQLFDNRLYVLTAPADMPLMEDASEHAIADLLAQLEKRFDYIIIDMPKMMSAWTDRVLELCHLYLGVIEVDDRTQQNVPRALRAMEAASLPFDKIHYVLNRAPKLNDTNGQNAVTSLAEELGVSIDLQFSDGGAQVSESNNQGKPLAEIFVQNNLRKQIQNLAASLHGGAEG